jgi:hypothetical protein
VVVVLGGGAVEVVVGGMVVVDGSVVVAPAVTFVADVVAVDCARPCADDEPLEHAAASTTSTATRRLVRRITRESLRAEVLGHETNARLSQVALTQRRITPQVGRVGRSDWEASSVSDQNSEANAWPPQSAVQRSTNGFAIASLVHGTSNPAPPQY